MLDNNNDLISLLIVDDSAMSRRFISGLLPKDKFIITQAQSGREAITKILTNKYDIVLLDLLMNDLDGFEVLDYVQIKNIDLPIIVISADIQETTKTRCLEMGAETLINKPPKQEILTESINTALAKRKVKYNAT